MSFSGLPIARRLENSLLASMMAVGMLLPETGWNIDFFGRLITGKKLFGLSDYMFQKEKSRFLRSLSLFHVILPPLILLMLVNYGYHEKAIYYQTLLEGIIFPLSYFSTRPEENVNWVFGPGSKPQKKIKPPLYQLIVMLVFPLFIYLPSHLLLEWIFNS